MASEQIRLIGHYVTQERLADGQYGDLAHYDSREQAQWAIIEHANAHRGVFRLVERWRGQDNQLLLICSTHDS